MAERAFAARLAEIDMSEHEASQYEALFAPIAEQVQLRPLSRSCLLDPLRH